MKTVLMLAAATCAIACAPPDLSKLEFYTAAADGSKVPIDIGSIDSASIASLRNDNSLYELQMSREAGFKSGHESVLLKVGDNFISCGSDPGSGTVQRIHGFFDNKADALAIASAFQIPLKNRIHPGYKLTTTFTPSKHQYVVGEIVTVRLQIENHGDRSVTFQQGGRNRGKRDNQFAFTGEYAGVVLSDVGDPVHYGGIGSDVTLQPGSSFDSSVDLSKWFVLDEPGRYLMRGSYYMSFVDDDHKTIWEDFACSEFSFVIAKSLETGEEPHIF